MKGMSPNTQYDRHNIRQVERHRCHRKDRIRRDWTREVEQTWQDAEEGREPNGADGSLGDGVHAPEKPAVGQAVVPAERVDVAGAGLEAGLADKEGGEADEGL